MNITTFNSKTGIDGQRYNLVVNEDTKQLYYHSCNTWNLGNIINELGIRQINKMYKDFIKDGYTEVKHSEVKKWNNY